MFVVPLLMAIIFTMLAITSIKKPDMTGFFASMISSITWFIFGLTWPAVATEDLFVSIGYLWYAVGTIFAILTLYMGLRMMGSIFEQKKTPRLAIQNNDSGEE